MKKIIVQFFNFLLAHLIYLLKEHVQVSRSCAIFIDKTIHHKKNSTDGAYLMNVMNVNTKM